MIELLRRESTTAILHRPSRLVVARERADAAQHHDKNKSATAADDERQKDRQDRFAGRGFMRFGEADAFHHQAPDAGNRPAASRHDHQRISRADRVTEDSQRRLIAPFRPAHQHEAQMHDPRPDEESDREHDRKKDQDENAAKPEPDHTAEHIVIAQRPERTDEEAEDKIKDPAHASADHGVDQRIHQVALRLHIGECHRRVEQHQLERLKEGRKKTKLLAAIPRQTALRDNRDSRRRRAGHGSARGCALRRGKLRQRQPCRHPFVPEQIGREKSPVAQALPNFFLRKNTEFRFAAIDLDGAHAPVLSDGPVRVNPG